MDFKIKELEKQLEIACATVRREFVKKYSNDIYLSAGGSKLEAFINDLQQELEATATAFLKQHSLEKDSDAKKRVFNTVKNHAKKCIESFSRV